MPVWPFFIIATVFLALWGWRHNAWEMPALALCGYIATRISVTYAPDQYLEVAVCALWLFFASVMVYRGGAIPGFFFALSALTYPTLLIFGFRIEYMGLTPFIADVFAVLALLSIGGGIYGMASNSNIDNSRVLGLFQSHSVGMASRNESNRSSL